MGVRGTVALGMLALALLLPGPAEAGLEDLVNPFAGTEASAPDFGTGGGAGNTFPGATVPFGMVAFSPDTIPGLVNFPGGYTYSDDRIRGFSLTHYSGAGCAIFQDVPILPLAGTLSSAPVVAGSSDLPVGLAPTFDHDQESARPGFYSVTLNPGTPSRVRSELTASTRTAVGRFTFPGADSGTVTLNAGGSTMANFLARVEVDPAKREVTGVSESGRFCFEPSRYRVYFAAEFDRPFSNFGTWTDDVLAAGSRSARDVSPEAFNYKPVAGGPPFLPGNPSTTAQAGAFVSFDTSDSTPVEVRIGISYVSIAQARRNLVESRRRSFPEVRRRSERRWEEALDTVAIRGGLRSDRRTFATALYHSMLEPSVQSDVNGLYRGQDLEVHRLPPGEVHYSDISGWDIYRSQVQLLAMLQPRRASDVVRSLLRMERQGGCLPRWPYATQNTNVMNGDPSSPIIATAYALGVRGFDARAALRAMVKGADRPCRTENGDYTEREALSEYLDLGWIPHELNVSAGTRSLVDRKAPWGTAATSLEYAIADFSVSRLAEALGRERLALRFRERAANWRNLVNPGNTAIEPRMSDGTFAPGVTPESEDGFVEGSSAQYGWLVPHDMAGRIATLGGRKEALSNLNRFFTELNAGPASAYAFLGNEPTLHTPWIYNWLGNPARAQAVVRRAQIELFGPGPGGLPGNDDGGTMSAWYVLSSLGLSPVIPGTDVMPLGSPLFPRAVVEAGGRSLRFFSPHAARNRPYVRSLRIDGRPWPRPWLRLSRLGPETRFDWSLSGKPSRWAISRRFSPPSFPPSP